MVVLQLHIHLVEEPEVHTAEQQHINLFLIYLLMYLPAKAAKQRKAIVVNLEKNRKEGNVRKEFKEIVHSYLFPGFMVY